MRTVSRSESRGLACVAKIPLFCLHPSVSTKDRADANFLFEGRQEKHEETNEIAISGFPAANR